MFMVDGYVTIYAPESLFLSVIIGGSVNIAGSVNSPQSHKFHLLNYARRGQTNGSLSLFVGWGQFWLALCIFW